MRNKRILEWKGAEVLDESTKGIQSIVSGVGSVLSVLVINNRMPPPYNYYPYIPKDHSK